MSHLANSTNVTAPARTFVDFNPAGSFTNEGASGLVRDALQGLSQSSGGGVLPDFNTVQTSFFGNTTFTPQVRPNSFQGPAFTAFTNANGQANFPTTNFALDGQANFPTPNFDLASNAALAFNAQNIPPFPGFVNGRAP
jgi:hypothetical protein